MAILKKTTKKEKSVKVKPEIKPQASLNPKDVFVIKYPWITEKSHDMSVDGRYVFLVDPKSNKSEVKKAVATLYKVDAVSVNMLNFRGKAKHFGSKISKGKNFKKAIVTLKKGQKIDVMPT